ncbi:MAG: glutamate racemase [Salinivirgaceae bacterium]
MNENPIGIFDSGVGGLSVWDKVSKLLPNEDIIYLADSFNCPYGPKSPEEVIGLSVKNTEFLLSKNCKLIIVACNTATASAIEVLRQKFDVPFVGMEPAVKPAAENTTTGKIGILATKGTFEGRLFKQTSEKYAQHVDQLIQVGEGLVELVESNQIDSPEAYQLLKKYLTPMIEANADQIVLGCTHYPILIPIIEQIVPLNIQIIDPAPAIALRTKNLLLNNKLNNRKTTQGNYQFFSSGDTQTINLLIKKLTGKTIHTEII